MAPFPGIGATGFASPCADGVGAMPMKPTSRTILLIGAICLAAALTGGASAADRVKTADGVVEGAAVESSGVRAFKGIPFAAPPVGILRWRPPQPVKRWKGVRRADRFGPRAMQRPVFG